MKSDNSRITFDPRKHFSGVRMQQGRVQIDADSNEQIDIVNHRVETEAGDVVGLCGAPLHYPAFHIVGALKQLSPEEQALPGNQQLPAGFTLPDFLISAGRYYVDGILCENEQLTSYLKQPDLPNAAIVAAPGLYVVYLDVWQRLITALDDPSIREVALGGPDTATRTKTVWQVKHWLAVDTNKRNIGGNCLTTFDVFNDLTAPSSGTLSARSKRAQTSTDPCVVPPGAGYSGLENQLYRIEIHNGGEALNAIDTSGTKVTRVPNRSDQIKVSGDWTERQTIEIFSPDDLMNGRPANITIVEQASKKVPKTLTLDIDVSQIPFAEPFIREASATFKWSRDNGSVVTTIQSMNGSEVTVHDLRPDDALGFKVGQWVEISDDGLELNGLPGQLAQISKIDSALNRITLKVAPAPLDATQANGVNKDSNPKLRRWDGVGAVRFHPNVSQDHFLDLESGVQVRFFQGSFRTGDYWTVAARTATADTQAGNVDWPVDKSNQPLARLPFGIKHHYCRLAMLHWDGKALTVEDCRHLFPPISELTSMVYVSGDGQESMPGNPIPQPLQVGVFNGRWPVEDAQVRFSVSSAAGRFGVDLKDKNLDQGRLTTIDGRKGPSPTTLTVRTGPDGIASCVWLLDPSVVRPSQQVEARLLDSDEKVTPALVRFDGNLSIADQVFYDPGECGTLREQGTVQMALSRLSELRSLYKISGDGQEIMPSEKVAPFPLKVLVASPCGPVTDDKFLVTFRIVEPEKGASSGVVIRAEGGEGDKSISVVRGKDGFWTCNWQPDAKMPFQEVEASIQGDDKRLLTTPPTTVRFSLNLSTADHVKYTPGDCNLLKGSDTVQKAIDQLALAASLYEVSGNNQEVIPAKSVLELTVLAANKCGPVKGQNIGFKVISGKGKINAAEVVTKDDGMATTFWTIGPRDQQNQQVEARFMDSKLPIAPPSSVLFNAYFSQAGTVLYDPDPKACPDLAKANVTTVQAALDALCQRKSQEERIQAGNVLYDPSPKDCPDLAKAKVTTVQAALDALCQRKPQEEGIQAGKVLYDPNPKDCPDLAKAKVTTVQAALDALCRKSQDKPSEEAIHIKEIRTGTQALLNDTLVPAGRLFDGITIVCSQPLAPSIAYGNPGKPPSLFPVVAPKPTCFVTLDLPSPSEIFGVGLAGIGSFGFHPLILASNLELVKEDVMRWFPTQASITWLGNLFKQTALAKITDRVVAHLTLKGNFIVSAPPAAEMWLDGEAFAVRSSIPTDPLDLRLGGDGRRGGDFEMWFWLVPG